MYNLRSGGGNHYTLWANNRSDYSIIRHPEFQLGRIPSERDSLAGWNTSKGKHKPILSKEAKLIRASAKQRSATSEVSASAPSLALPGTGEAAERERTSRDPDLQSLPPAELAVLMRQASMKRSRGKSVPPSSQLTPLPLTVQATHNCASVPGRMADVDRKFRYGSGSRRVAAIDPDFHIQRASKSKPVGYGRFQYIPPESAKGFLQKWTESDPAPRARGPPPSDGAAAMKDVTEN
mmetsp:Transcript_76368/g.181623  ORF Transcript_76368/g.181623 Transcript_76368/m.181623 type:complete len:236 (-) Transcript_76368:176-883(-)|eukprot:CAMPEP_0178443010 /NCGR_PEP_ID=MMETSP0689_2-20121128/38568_1 /TAXON_ID=160604 /ORGANISM="Amphidinium massartii, Strain CS-259" /LENGTH=235 /DNA_ID=CAMNT_0020066791 /DNA_START=100 /DNA_END=807 /DNA_ORIENTATION=+